MSMSHAVIDWESNRKDCRCSKSNHLPDRLSAMCPPLLGGQTAGAQGDDLPIRACYPIYSELAPSLSASECYKPPTQHGEAICGVRFFLQQPHMVQQAMIPIRIIPWLTPYMSQIDQRDSITTKERLSGSHEFLITERMTLSLKLVSGYHNAMHQIKAASADPPFRCSQAAADS